MDKRELINDIKGYLDSEFQVTAVSGEPIRSDDDLFEDAIGYNSIDALQFLVFLESKYDIEIPYEDLDINALRSVSTIADLLYRLTGGKE